ncbi:MAG: hypothetical protein KBS57_02920 [Alistipes sp.]|nr:hypothetical protein [Candidatus Minthomonas equi]
MHRITVLLTILLSTSLSAFSQQTQQEVNDSLVRLLTASRARILEEGGKTLRKVEGDVIFLHNNTYLYCDTALWHVEDEFIDAVGHVQIVQENTILSSDKLHYDIPADLATFRGVLVQLEDKDSNILRTRNLDYNTRDSIAYFREGASMRDKDGNVIESLDGRFESKSDLFTFSNEVEMFSDSAFFTCDTLHYETGRELATFRNNAKAWFGKNHIRSDGGWYDRISELVCFDDGVYMQTDTYEGWCDEVRYDRRGGNVKMYRDVQVLDTVHNAMAAGGFLDYYDSPRKVFLSENPSVIGIQKDSVANGVADTIFVRADTLIFEYLMKYQVKDEVANAESRLETLNVDVVLNKRANAASEAAAAAAAREARESAERRGPFGKPGGRKGETSPASEVSTVAKADTLSPLESMAMVCDSLSMADSLFIFDAEFGPDSAMVAAMDSVSKNWKDTAQVQFFHGFHNVRMYKSNMQMVCDSLEYSTLDSIVRLYRAPIVWKDIKTQLNADSMQFVIRNGSIDRGIMLSNAMIVSEHSPDKYYHQIKSPEMTAYFTSDGSALRRFDAVGGVQALFFMEEDSVVTMMNQKDAKIMNVTFKNGEVQKMLYMESVKSDAYPVRKLWKEDPEKMKLKGYGWYKEKRPADRFAVTAQILRPSVRQTVLDEEQFPSFPYTGEFFAGYMEDVLKCINEREPIIWRPKPGRPVKSSGETDMEGDGKIMPDVSADFEQKIIKKKD